MADRKYYVFCGDNCRFEGMTKEQIYAAIVQAVENGEIRNIDTGFVTRIKEQNGGRQVTLWVGTQAQYNAIEAREENCLYIITDDTAFEDLRDALQQLRADFESRAKDVDISGAVNTAFKQPNGEMVEQKIIYSEAAQIVHYFFHVKCRTDINEGDSINIVVGADDPLDAAIMPKMFRGSAVVSASTDENIAEACFIVPPNLPALTLNIKAKINLAAGRDLCITGWYFAEGGA